MLQASSVLPHSKKLKKQTSKMQMTSFNGRNPENIVFFRPVPIYLGGGASTYSQTFISTVHTRINQSRVVDAATASKSSWYAIGNWRETDDAAIVYFFLTAAGRLKRFSRYSACLKTKKSRNVNETPKTWTDVSKFTSWNALNVIEAREV